MRAVRLPLCSLPFRILPLRTLFAAALLLASAAPALAQTYYRVTQGWCAQNGGHFRHTGQVGTDIGECTILPRQGGGSTGGGGGGSSGGTSAGRLGAAVGILGIMRDMARDSERRQAQQDAHQYNENGRWALDAGRYQEAIDWFEQSANLWAQLGDGNNAQISWNNATIARNAWAEQDRQAREAQERRQEAERQRQEDERRRADEERRQAEAEAAARARQASSGQGASGGAARPAVKGARRDTNCTGPVPDDVAGCYEQPRLSNKQLAAQEAERKRAERRAKRDQLREALRVKEKRPAGDGGVVDEEDLQVAAADPPKQPEPPAKPPPMHWDRSIPQQECTARRGRWATPQGDTLPACLLDGPGRGGQFTLSGPETDAAVKEMVDEQIKRAEEQSKAMRESLFQRNQDALRRAQQAGKVGP